MGHQHISKYANMHIHGGHSGRKTWRCPPAVVEIIHNAELDTWKRWIRTRQETPLPNEKQIDNDWWQWHKGKRRIIPFLLHKQILQQLHSNYMGTESWGSLRCELVCWIIMNTDIKNTMKQCATCTKYQQTELHTKIIPYEMPYKAWKVVCVAIFIINNKKLWCFVDYYSKFHVVKKTDGPLAETLIRVPKIVFAEFGLPGKTVADADTYFIDKFRHLCRQLNIDQVINSSYHNQSNMQVEASIKFMKHTIKMCMDNNDDINLALLNMRSTLVGTGLPSPATLLSPNQSEFCFPKWIANQSTLMLMMSIMRS